MKATKFRSFSVIFVMFIALAALAISVVNAQGIPDVPREDTAIFDIDGGNPTNPNPFNHNLVATTNAAGGNVGTGQVVYEPLFILNYETGEIEPWLGESMTPNETLDVWTLQLREGAYWQDSETLDIDDVMFTMNLLLDDETGTLANASALQSWVESVEKVDDLSMTFTLKRPNPRFQLDYFSVKIGGSFLPMPEHIWSQVEVFEFTNFDLEAGHPVGSGPYKMVSASENEFIYDRDDNWWGAATGNFPLPEPKRVIWVQTGNDDVRGILSIDNQLDSVMDVTVGAWEAIRAQNPNMIAWQDGPPWVWFGPCARRATINHTIAPWGNPNMRWALSHATDRNEVVRIAYEGATNPSRSMFPEYGGLINPYINALDDAGLTLSFDADVAAAQALIEAEGYALNDAGIYEKDGEELSINIQAHEGFIEKRRIAENLVEQWRGVGINTTQQNVAGGTWNDNKALGNFEAVLDWDQCGSVNEPWASMDRDNVNWLAPIGERAPGGHNIARWSGEKADAYGALVDQIAVLPIGDPTIMPLFLEAIQLWYDELPTLPITQATKLIPFNNTYWTNWPSAENNYFQAPTWWHSTSKIILNLKKAQ